jgi:hypothetical protein
LALAATEAAAAVVDPVDEAAVNQIGTAARTSTRGAKSRAEAVVGERGGFSIAPSDRADISEATLVNAPGAPHHGAGGQRPGRVRDGRELEAVFHARRMRDANTDGEADVLSLLPLASSENTSEYRPALRVTLV